MQKSVKSAQECKSAKKCKSQKKYEKVQKSLKNARQLNEFKTYLIVIRSATVCRKVQKVQT